MGHLAFASVWSLIESLLGLPDGERSGLTAARVGKDRCRSTPGAYEQLPMMAMMMMLLLPRVDLGAALFLRLLQLVTGAHCSISAPSSGRQAPLKKAHCVSLTP